MNVGCWPERQNYILNGKVVLPNVNLKCISIEKTWMILSHPKDDFFEVKLSFDYEDIKLSYVWMNRLFITIPEISDNFR